MSESYVDRLNQDAEIAKHEERIDSLLRERDALREALEKIKWARDHCAESGESFEDTIGAGRYFDDWAADIAAAALTPAREEGKHE